jgi:hydrogenase maturation factor
MCLAIPMVLVERNEFEGVAEMVHAGYAIGQVDADEAAKTLELLREYSDAMAEL